MEVLRPTSRLRFHRLSLSDLEWIQEMDCDPEVMRYINPNHQVPTDDSKARQWLERLEAKYPGPSPLGFYAGVDQATGEWVGWWTLRPAPDYTYAKEADFRADELELGYRLRRRFWNQGYATEAARALVELAKAEVGFRSVVAIAFVANRGSTRVMEKCGLLYERTCQFPQIEGDLAIYRLDLAPGGENSQ